MSRFVFGLISFRNAGADSRCRATPIRTGSKPSGSSSPNQVRVDVAAGVWPPMTRLLGTANGCKLYPVPKTWDAIECQRKTEVRTPFRVPTISGLSHLEKHYAS